MKSSDIKMLVVYADGGCLGNGTSNVTCYGSYVTQAVLIKGTVIVKEDRQFALPEVRTNNQAEYAALLRALHYLTAPERLPFMKQLAQIVIKMDSGLIVHQVKGSWKVKDADLKPLHAEAVKLIDEIGADLQQVERRDIVSILGH